MPTNSQTQDRHGPRADLASSFPNWFLGNLRRYQVWPGVVVDRPLGPEGSPWWLYFGDPPGVPNTIMQADHLWVGKDDAFEWGRWIDELRHRGLIRVADGKLESFHLFRRLAVGDWPVQYRTADERVVTIERKLQFRRRVTDKEVPDLVFRAQGRAGTVPWLIDVPTPHFMLTPEGFDAESRIDFGLRSTTVRSLRPVVLEEQWLTVTECAELLLTDVSGLDLKKAKARVSWAAGKGKFRTNGKKGSARRIDRDSCSTWRLEQRERDLDADNDGH